jgi:hypothetical protein
VSLEDPIRDVESGSVSAISGCVAIIPFWDLDDSAVGSSRDGAPSRVINLGVEDRESV